MIPKTLPPRIIQSALHVQSRTSQRETTHTNVSSDRSWRWGRGASAHSSTSPDDVSSFSSSAIIPNWYRYATIPWPPPLCPIYNTKEVVREDFVSWLFFLMTISMEIQIEGTVLISSHSHEVVMFFVTSLSIPHSVCLDCWGVSVLLS